MSGGYYIGGLYGACIETIYSVDYSRYVICGCVTGEDGIFTRYFAVLYLFYSMAYIFGGGGVSIFRDFGDYFYI